MGPDSLLEFVTQLRGNILHVPPSEHFHRFPGDYVIRREIYMGNRLLIYPVDDLRAELKQGVGDKTAGVYGIDNWILPSLFLGYVGLRPDSEVKVIVYDSEIIEILNPEDTERSTTELKERLKQLATSLSQRGI